MSKAISREGTQLVKVSLYHELFPEVPFVRCGSIASAGMELAPFGENEGTGLVS